MKDGWIKVVVVIVHFYVLVSLPLALEMTVTTCQFVQVCLLFI